MVHSRCNVVPGRKRLLRFELVVSDLGLVLVLVGIAVTWLTLSGREECIRQIGSRQ